MSKAAGSSRLEPQLVLRYTVRGRLPEGCLPKVCLPEGYTLRGLREGEEDDWRGIIASSFERQMEDISFDVMRNDTAFAYERILCVCYDDVPVATTSAWRRVVNGKAAGYLHYVGTLPGHGGKKLGYTSSLGAMHQLLKEGFDEIYLQTDDFRGAALKTYLRLGFEPYLIDDNQRERWRVLFGEALAGFEREGYDLDTVHGYESRQP